MAGAVGFLDSGQHDDRAVAEAEGVVAGGSSFGRKPEGAGLRSTTEGDGDELAGASRVWSGEHGHRYATEIVVTLGHRVGDGSAVQVGRGRPQLESRCSRALVIGKDAAC